jgi:hypothetical protein
MNSKLPKRDERNDITSLVSRATSDLATRASLISRGLQDISERLRADSLKAAQDKAGLELNPLDEECRSKNQIALLTEELGIDWNRPTLLLDVGSWWREPINYPHSPGIKCFNFVCELKFLPDSPRHAKLFHELEYLSDDPREAGKEITVYRRSRTTGEMCELGEGLLLHDQEGGPLILELLRAFPEDMSDEDCIRELADGAYQTVAYDPAYGNVILFSWR